MNTMSDPREKLFCSFKGPDVFQSVQHANMIGIPDPYDVEEINTEARAVLERQLSRITTPDELSYGCVALILGESGSGKTHLMRSFRNSVHERGLGCFAYMQMTTSVADYGKYVLSNVIDSFYKPYYLPNPLSTILRLSNSLVELKVPEAQEQIRILKEADMNYDLLGETVHILTHLILKHQFEAIDNLDADVISALLYLQTDHTEIRSPVYKYLRCQPMTKFDGDALAAIGTAGRENANPLHVLETIGRLIHITQRGSLIICFDQLEDIMETMTPKQAEVNFRSAIATINHLCGTIPSSMMIVSCMEDQYTELKDYLSKSALDRLENDPKPVRLTSGRKLSEIEKMVSRRLQHLFETNDIEYKEEEPVYPINVKFLESMEDNRTRDILIRCKEYRNICANAGEIIPPESTPLPDPPPSQIEQGWNDFLNTFEADIPPDDAGLAQLLAWAVETVVKETGRKNAIRVESVEDRILNIRVSDETIVAGVCNKNPQGGALGKQIQEVEKLAKGCTPVIVRSIEFPSNPNTRIAQQLGQLIVNGGRRAVVNDSDWRMICVMREFLKRNQSHPDIDTWMQSEKHVSSLSSIRDILDLESLENRNQQTEVSIPEEADVVISKAATEKPNTITDSKTSDTVHLGWHREQPIQIGIQDLTRHAVFLGGTGSGKTTAALNIIEQLLLKKIPVVMVDRKGDLCGYAKRDFLNQSSTANLEFRRKAFADTVEPVIFTPGDPRGRSLSISVVPEGLAELPLIEQQQASRFTAQAIGQMMGYRSRLEQNRIPILSKAIELLVKTGPQEPLHIQHLIDFVDSVDPILIEAVGQFDKRLFNKLAEDMRVLKLNLEPLLVGNEKLTAETLLGLHSKTAPASQTRLTIISTKFLGDQQIIQFWIMKLLLEMSHWASKHPSDRLQAVLFFDEADMYLPAVGKPATKEPMENLIKRARSAGIGLLLASQNPGDFDYKCRDNIQTWLVGKIQERTSLAKMRPMFSDYSALEIETSLSKQETGMFHLLTSTGVQPFQSDRSLMKTDQLSENEILVLAKKATLQRICCPDCKISYKIIPSRLTSIQNNTTCKKCGQPFCITVDDTGSLVVERRT